MSEADDNVINLAAKFVAQQKLQRIEKLRDHLDSMAKAAAEAGREDDRVALDAGSFALTHIIKESQAE